MWAYLIKAASLGKGALVVGVAASAAMVSNAEFSNVPSHVERPNVTAPAAIAAPPSTTAKPERAAEPKAPEKPGEKPADKPADKPSPQAGETPAQASPKPTTEEGSTHSAVPQIVKECVERYLALRELGDRASAGDRQSTSEICKAALAKTGLSSAEFWAKYGNGTTTEPRPAPKTEPKTPKTEPKTEPSGEAEHWIRECMTQYRLRTANASETCRKAIELSGLTSREFAAKFLGSPTVEVKPPVTSPATPAPETATPKPSTTPKPDTTVKPVTNATEVTQIINRCVQLYAAVVARTSTDTRAVSEACGVAIRASGLSSADFWAKYGPTKN